MKIVVLDGYALNPGDMSWKAFEELADFKVYDNTSSKKIVERIGSAELVLTNKVVLNKDVINSCPLLKYIGILATGYNIVDLEAASNANITVTNIPAYSTDSVAQLVFSHLLNIVNRVQLHADSVKNGDWVNSPDFSFWLSPQTELAGKTLGIIGFGRIGQKVAEIGHAFGMTILFQNRSQKKNVASYCRQCELDELLQKSDVVSLNCPLTENNREFMNKNLFAQMKHSAIIINTGRGALIEEQDLANALNEGSLAAAGLDVLSTEPPTTDNPLLRAKNAFITPHIAWATKEARQRMINIAEENLKAFLNRKKLNVIS
ncbi:D-2-hydroxyacid dehydrogenase [uncultured Sunxiuqinia sp.]|uniref:D-2-hydroxyacid dehydrogenase n=1 Tax=uncultured Sunxiuqinia sp. TaxID=1573825 RepID=UPI002AA60635|nr:D-2-hydroxyacid dehydrogenase [uncultured Sunxiuqinia sp.]